MQLPLWANFVIIPLVGAFIGWITNYLAVKMLFHPKKERRILGVSLHGVFPKRQADLAREIGELVSLELFSMHEVANRLEAKAGASETRELLRNRIESALSARVYDSAPLFGLILSRRRIGSIVDRLMPGLDGVLGELVNKFSRELSVEMDIREIVTRKIAGFSSDELERVVLSIMRRELKWIELVGGVLGLLIGLLQVFLTNLTLAFPGLTLF